MSTILESALSAEQRAQANAADLAAAKALRKPTSPRLMSAWLARVATDAPHLLLNEAQALAKELDLLKGNGHKPQRGCSFVTKPLGEYEFTPGRAGRYFGPPEDCCPDEPAEVTILQVFINGTWCDPSDFLADSIIERWQEEIEQEACGSAADDRDGWRDIDARHAA